MGVASFDGFRYKLRPSPGSGREGSPALCKRGLPMGNQPFENFDSEVVTKSERKLKPPPLYRVLLHNDDYTTMEFVVQVLESVFHRSHAEATEIMLHIHRNGIGVAGTYTYEIAETKVAVVEALARRHEFPLKCTMEEN